MVHDWFDHGAPVKENKIKVHLEKGDPLFEKMKGNFHFTAIIEKSFALSQSVRSVSLGINKIQFKFNVIETPLTKKE